MEFMCDTAWVAKNLRGQDSRGNPKTTVLLKECSQ